MHRKPGQQARLERKGRLIAVAALAALGLSACDNPDRKTTADSRICTPFPEAAAPTPPPRRPRASRPPPPSRRRIQRPPPTTACTAGPTPWPAPPTGPSRWPRRRSPPARLRSPAGTSRGWAPSVRTANPSPAARRSPVPACSLASRRRRWRSTTISPKAGRCSTWCRPGPGIVRRPSRRRRTPPSSGPPRSRTSPRSLSASRSPH
jgi:hypothetical protein